MSLNFVKIQIESQKKNYSNYIKHNGIRYCKDLINSGKLNRFQKKEVKILLLKFESVEDPWDRTGIPRNKEVLGVLKLLEDLEEIIE